MNEMDKNCPQWEILAIKSLGYVIEGDWFMPYAVDKVVVDSLWTKMLNELIKE